MSKIPFKDLSIEHIVKPNLKHSYISVGKNLEIIIKTPTPSKRFLERLLLEKEGWIRKQLFKIKSIPKQEVSLEDELLLFGDIYSIDSLEAAKLRDILNNIKVKSSTKVLKAYDNFYKELAQEYLSDRLEYYASVMGLKYTQVKFKKLKSRWGSCSSHRVITLNTRLMLIEKELIDYVIVHELSHLVYMNHSKEFHNHVESYLENSKAKRAKLKQIAPL
jgi:predicted metal-dependent hydrolase